MGCQTRPSRVYWKHLFCMSDAIQKITPLTQVLQDEADFDARRKSRSRYTLLGNVDHPRRILIHGAAFVITTDRVNKVKVVPHQSIYIVDGIIKEVFPVSKKSIPINKIDVLYDGSKRGGIVVTPGFVNCHTHPPMYMLRSSMTLDKGNVVDQVAKMAKLEAKMNANDFYLGALGDFTEEQKNGITTTLTHYATFQPIDDAARATKHRVINAVSAVSNSHPENTPAMVEKILKNRKSYFTTPAISIHYVHKATPAQLKKISQIVKKHKVLFTLHAAESEEYVQSAVEKFGERTIGTLVKYGLAGPQTVISHAVHLSPEEIRLIKKYKIGVVHLPTSNKLHKSGEFNYPEFVRAKADGQIALGTDSVISKNSLDLLSEALQARIMHIDRHRITYEDLFRMMTSQGAEVLGLKNVGKILPGYRADLAFWKLKDRGFLPYNETKPVSLIGNMITHGGRNIRDLMINGEFIISNRMHNLVNESELMMSLQGAHMKLRKRLDKK
jgi:5-methylthioadenosine/S-adenosylhomocysteine deaminase